MEELTVDNVMVAFAIDKRRSNLPAPTLVGVVFTKTIKTLVSQLGKEDCFADAAKLSLVNV